MNRSIGTCIATTIALGLATATASGQSSRVPDASSRPATEEGSATIVNSIRVHFDLPAQSLAESLRAIGRRTDTNILIDLKMVENLKAPALSDSLTVDEAIARILDGTSIQHRFIDQHTIVLSTIKSAPTTSIASTAEPLRFAQAEEQSAEGPVGDPQSDTTEATDGLAEIETTLTRMPEVLVKGSRVSINADIERTENDVQPYVVFTAEEIQRSMAVNIEDFLKNRLPMNTSSSTNRQNTHTGSNVSEFNLRGLGTDETLVLVNGRRRAGVSNIADSSGQKNNFGQPDLNGIPLMSIERIEVLPATAAGIYGGGATGGVINIILKTDFTGVDVAAGYANTFDTDAATKSISATGGTTLAGGKTAITLAASYSEQNTLVVHDRDFQSRARKRALENNRDFYKLTSIPLPIGNLVNIRNTVSHPFLDENGQDTGFGIYDNLVLKDGGDIGSPFTHVPVGYGGDVQQLLANSGVLNLELANDINNGGRSIQNSPRTNSLNLTINQQFTDWFSMFVNVAREENHGSVLYAGLTNSAIVAANAPTNPFTTEIEVSFPLPGRVFYQQFDSESLDIAAAATFKLPLHWVAQLESGWSRGRTRTAGGTPYLIGDILDPARPGVVIKEGVSSSIYHGTLDVLRDPHQSPLDLSSFSLPYPNTGNGGSDANSPTGGVLRLSGPLLRLPAGEVTLSSLFEHHKTVAEETIVQVFSESIRGQSQYFYYPSRTSTTDSFYLETNVPLISSLNSRRWLKSLNVQASARRDENKTHSVETGAIEVSSLTDRPDLGSITYSDSSVAATGYTFGLSAAPTQDLMLRMSFSHGFLPPSIAQIGSRTQAFGSNPNDIFGVPDPDRRDELIGTHPVTVIDLGNPNLKSELSDSISAGLILTPRFLEGVRFSIDYTRIEKTDEINDIDFYFLMAHPDLYPGRVVRGPELGDGLPGPITHLDLSMINIDRTLVEAFDFQIDYALSTARAGSFNFYTVASMQSEYARRFTARSETVDSIGFRNGPLKWRGNIGFDWNLGAVSMGWNMQYFHSYLIYSTTEVGEAPILIQNQGFRRFRPQTYHDLSFRYSFGGGLFNRINAFEDVVITGGIQNVLNTKPQSDVASDGGYSTYGDPLLRRYTLNLSKSF